MTKKPRFGASSTHFPQSNRPVQPSAPNPCSYIPGKGECKPPKWCFSIVHPRQACSYIHDLFQIKDLISSYLYINGYFLGFFIYILLLSSLLN
jgi:hypothetical protein